MKSRILAIVLSAISVNAMATEFIVRGATISDINSVDRRPAATYQNADSINLAGLPAWTAYLGTGGPACFNGVAILANNAFQKSIALAAFAAGTPVTVLVDNTLPYIVDGPNIYCTVTLLYAKK